MGPDGARCRDAALGPPRPWARPAPSLPDGPPPDFGLYLLGRPPEPTGWAARWVRWPDFRLPADPADLRAALGEALDRAAGERVELACAGGRGRTGTALACLAVLDGVPPAEAVAWIRERYDARAVETPFQRRFVRRFTPG
ncbi:protein-tyrosine phosphatase family protein [Nocardioides humi]|uniref:protein-tyrosine phosphatase family protein n=1 Tax=Nocardioides humi TaxID=449461 RepID=UPI001FE256E4|nr:protein phosphatase [Nocardioides humi]